jgi:S1-C subfamily serine protease
MKWHLFFASVLSVGLTLGQAAALRANEIYDEVAPATAMFYDVTPTGSSVAAGVLVDTDRKLVVTAEHVVHRVIRDGTFKTSVMFPALDKAGKVNTNAAYYKKNRQALSIPGEVIYFDRTKDLAIVRLERLPAGLKAIPLAAGELEPGDKLHVIGNSTFYDGGAFDYCAGTVRNLFFMHKVAVTPAGFPVRDKVFFSLCNDVPTNQGDSGGPTVNNKGELVAIVSNGTISAGGATQVVDTSVHVREIRRALDGMRQPAGNTLELSASVDSAGFDCFFIPVTKGNKLSATLKGQGSSDLDLWLKDSDLVGNLWLGADGSKSSDYGHVLESVGPTDQEQIAGTVTWSGMALVQVQNVAQKGNKYTLKIDWTHEARSPFTFIRRLAAKGSDSIKLTYEAGKGKARVSVRGDGDTTLQMEVLDPKGASVGKIQTGTGYHDLHNVTWEPTLAGTYTVRIDNPGAIWSEYVFTTD